VLASAEERKVVMSVRKRVTPPPPETRARLDVVLRVGMNVAPIGTACPKEIFKINNMLNDTKSTDEEIVNMLNEFVKSEQCRDDPAWPIFLGILRKLTSRPGVQLWTLSQGKD